MESQTKSLRALLDEKFFNSCLIHQEDRRNDENSFCMDCCFSLCIHCMPHHQHHKILQVRRYMYNDVLRLKDAQKIFDCSRIQSYTTNNEKVVLLRPRQHVSSLVKGSRFTCLICNQNIKLSSSYCSMSCKLHKETASGGGQGVYDDSSSGGLRRSFLVAGSVSECLVSDGSSVEVNSTNGETKSVKQVMASSTSNKGFTFTRKLHGRKCVPQRSPFF